MNFMVFNGAAIRRARKARGLTLESAGSRVGASKFAVSRWENEMARPNEAAARKLQRCSITAGMRAQQAGRTKPSRFAQSSMTMPEWRADTQRLK